KNLLPAGIFQVKGSFYPGDIVEVFGVNGLIGKGEVTYSSNDLLKIMGQKSKEQTKRVNSTPVEVIHREKWVSI
ncbi:glutamate 5-kinase, partial [Microvirga sp. 3-52]|nr:glutamate 5-kinase [Microvirga sp. 3-52]